MVAVTASACVQWFYMRRERWEPFGELENTELEDAHLYGRDVVEFGAGRYPAILSQRIQHNYDANSQRKILRGIWFFQRSDGTLSPYPETVASELQREFSVANGGQRRESSGIGVSVDNQRTVYRAVETGEFAQVHKDTQTVRWVTINYIPGNHPLKTVTPLSWQHELLDGSLSLTRYKCDPDNQDQTPSRQQVRDVAKFHLIQWWCHRSGTWEHYSEKDNGQLEAAYSPPRRMLVPVCEGSAVVDIVSKTERTAEGAVYPIIRTKWHVQRSDGTLMPFDESDSAMLEDALVIKPADRVADHHFTLKLRALRAKRVSAVDFQVP